MSCAIKVLITLHLPISMIKSNATIKEPLDAKAFNDKSIVASPLFTLTEFYVVPMRKKAFKFNK